MAVPHWEICDGYCPLLRLKDAFRILLLNLARASMISKNRCTFAQDDALKYVSLQVTVMKPAIKVFKGKNNVGRACSTTF